MTKTGIIKTGGTKVVTHYIHASCLKEKKYKPLAKKKKYCEYKEEIKHSIATEQGRWSQFVVF